MRPDNRISACLTKCPDWRFFVCSLAMIALPVQADTDGAALFQQKCTVCHTIGNGKLVGPDLVAVHQWSDADLNTAVNRMKTYVGPLSDDEIANLVKYLKSPAATPAVKTGTRDSGAMALLRTPLQAEATGSGSPAQASATTTSPGGAARQSALAAGGVAGAQAPATTSSAPGSAQTGRLLFTGQRAFANGGISCISCHQAEANGGTLGPSLTDVASRMPENGLAAACQTTPFPAMKDLYAAHPVTQQEASDLTAYFESVKGKRAPEREVPVGWLGIGGAVAMLGLIAWGYCKRNSNVRSKLQRK